MNRARFVAFCSRDRRRGTRRERGGPSDAPAAQSERGCDRRRGRRRDGRRAGRLRRRRRASDGRRAAKRFGLRRRGHHRRRLLHHPRHRVVHGRAAHAGHALQRRQPRRREDARGAVLCPAQARPTRHARLLRRQRQLGQQPPSAQVRGLAARRGARGGQRSRAVHPRRRAGHRHLSGLGLLRDRRPPVLGGSPPRPAEDPASRLRAAQPRHRRERAQHRRTREHPLPRAAHQGATRAARAHQVREPAAGRERRQALPSARPDGRGRRRRSPRRQADLSAEPGRVAPARRAHSVDQRRLAVPVDHAPRRALSLPRRPEPLVRTRHVVRCPRQAGLRGHARGHQRPRPGRHHALLPQRPERPLPLPARRYLRAHATERVRGRGRAVPHRRQGGRRAGGRQPRQARVEPGDRRAGGARHGTGRRTAADHRRQDVRARRGAGQAAGSHVGPDALGRPRRPLVSARVHAQPDTQRQRELRLERDDQRQGTLGLPPLVLDRLRPHRQRPRREPALRRRGLSAGGEPGDAQPVRGAQRLLRHHAGQRRRLPVHQGRAQGLQTPDPQRLRRSVSQPPVVLRRVERDRRRQDPEGDRSCRPTQGKSRCSRQSPPSPPTGRPTGPRTGAPAACRRRAPWGRR